MLVATFNINSIRTRIEILKKWINENNPDVLCLQETKCQDKDFPSSQIEEIGFYSSFMGEKSYNGVAILTRKKPSSVYYGFDGEGTEEGSRIITVNIEDIHIVNTYIPQGFEIGSDKYKYKLEWFDRLKKFFNDRFKKSDHIIWAGDFNVAYQDIDVHDPKRLLGHVCFNPEVSAKLKSITDFGFTDVFRKYNPEKGKYTFWDYRVKDAIDKGIGWRIDYIMSTDHLTKKTISCDVDIAPRKSDKPSDHTIVYAKFKD